MREENGKLKRLSQICRWTATGEGDPQKKAVKPRQRARVGAVAPGSLCGQFTPSLELMMINRATMNHQSRREAQTDMAKACD